MRGFGVIAALLACPVLAQELPYSDVQTLQCLQYAANPDAQTACIGLSSSACMNTELGGTTVGMGGCLDAEWQLWDRMLNQNYQLRMAEAKQIDAEMRDIGATVPSQASALRAMQRAWITFRDASCDYERSKWGGGTGGGPATVACWLELTGQQALALAATDR